MTKKTNCCQEVCCQENNSCDCEFRPLWDFVVIELVAKKKAILLINKDKQIDPNDVRFKVLCVWPDCKFVKRWDWVVPNAPAAVWLPVYKNKENEKDVSSKFVIKENQIYCVVNNVDENE